MMHQIADAVMHWMVRKCNCNDYDNVFQLKCKVIVDAFGCSFIRR